MARSNGRRSRGFSRFNGFRKTSSVSPSRVHSVRPPTQVLVTRQASIATDDATATTTGANHATTHAATAPSFNQEPASRNADGKPPHRPSSIEDQKGRFSPNIFFCIRRKTFYCFSLSLLQRSLQQRLGVQSRLGVRGRGGVVRGRGRGGFRGTGRGMMQMDRGDGTFQNNRGIVWPNSTVSPYVRSLALLCCVVAGRGRGMRGSTRGVVRGTMVFTRRPRGYGTTPFQFFSNYISAFLVFNAIHAGVIITFGGAKYTTSAFILVLFRFSFYVVCLQ